MAQRAPLLLLAIAALAAAGSALGARTRTADYPSIYVSFLSTNTLMVVLGDGTPVGTSSGAPSVIAPGTYNLLLDDSSLVADMTFNLSGPGVKLVSNMSYGEEPAETWVETFAPNSTYTWRDDMKPATVYTFTTSSTPSTGTANTGSAPGKPVSTTPISSGTNGKATSTDVVGSQVVPFRGTLAGQVSATGALTLTSAGKPVTRLRQGKYTIRVADRSRRDGFTLQAFKKTATTVTGTGFVGTRSVTLTLEPGQWFFYPTFIGKKTYFIVVA